jgi:hypothetical protein
MGMTSITGNQLFERMFLWARFDPKTYPRLPYVTRTTTRRLHLFTLIQFVCLAILYGLKAVKQTAMVFPFFIALLIFVRKGLDRIFTKTELRVLDAEEELGPEPEPSSEKKTLPAAMGKAPDEQQDIEELKKISKITPSIPQILLLQTQDIDTLALAEITTASAKILATEINLDATAPNHLDQLCGA